MALSLHELEMVASICLKVVRSSLIEGWFVMHDHSLLCLFLPWQPCRLGHAFQGGREREALSELLRAFHDALQFDEVVGGPRIVIRKKLTSSQVVVKAIMSLLSLGLDFIFLSWRGKCAAQGTLCECLRAEGDQQAWVALELRPSVDNFFTLISCVA